MLTTIALALGAVLVVLGFAAVFGGGGKPREGRDDWGWDSWQSTRHNGGRSSTHDNAGDAGGGDGSGGGD